MMLRVNGLAPLKWQTPTGLSSRSANRTQARFGGDQFNIEEFGNLDGNPITISNADVFFDLLRNLGRNKPSALMPLRQNRHNRHPVIMEDQLEALGEFLWGDEGANIAALRTREPSGLVRLEFEEDGHLIPVRILVRPATSTSDRSRPSLVVFNDAISNTQPVYQTSDMPDDRSHQIAMGFSHFAQRAERPRGYTIFTGSESDDAQS